MILFQNKNINRILLVSIMGLLFIFPNHIHALEDEIIHLSNEKNLLQSSIDINDISEEEFPQILPNTSDNIETNIPQILPNLENKTQENSFESSSTETGNTNLEKEQNLDLDVSIDVMPSMINVEVDFNPSFVINPNLNKNSRFVAPHITIRNNSVVPISVTAVSLKALGDSPKIVADNYYTDQEWSELNAKETRASIALGLVSLDNRFNSFYFKEESYQTPIVLEDCLNPYEEMSFRFQSKYGLYWKEECTLDYKLLIKILITE